MPYNLLTWFHIYCETVIDIRSHCKVVFIQSLTGEKFQKTWWQKSCKETDIRDGQKNVTLI